MSATRVTITFAELGPFLRKMGPKVEKAAIQGMRDAGNVLLRAVQEQISTTTPHQPVDTGQYRAGWQKTLLPLGCRIANDTPQAAWIELGRRPGPISREGFQHLVDWVRRKKLYLDELAIVQGHAASVSRHSMNRKRGADGARLSKKDAITVACERVAYAIKTKIEKNGLPPKFPFARALVVARDDMKAAVRARVEALKP